MCAQFRSGHAEESSLQVSSQETSFLQKSELLFIFQSEGSLRLRHLILLFVTNELAL